MTNASSTLLLGTDMKVTPDAVLASFTGCRRRWGFFGICLVLYGLTHIQLRLGLGV